MRDENNLKLSRFFLKHKIRTGSAAVATDIKLDDVKLLSEIKESDREQMDTLVSLLIDENNWTKIMESLKEYLKGNIGVKWV